MDKKSLDRSRHKSDLLLLKDRTSEGRLAIAIQLKYYQIHAQFLNHIKEIDDDVVVFLSAQTNTLSDTLDDYDCSGRTARQHKREIFIHLKIKPFTKLSEVRFRKWLVDVVFPEAPNQSYLGELTTEWFIENQFESPGSYRLARIIKSAEREFEEQLFQSIHDRLHKSTCARLDNLLIDTADKSEFSSLCKDTGPVGLESVVQTIDKIEIIRSLGFPDNILQGINPMLIERYRGRAAIENAWELRRHPPRIRYSLLTFYCIPREGELIDNLVDLFIQIIHRISARAERKVVKELINSIVKVHSKTTLLFHIAEAAWKNPDGAVRDVIFPVATEEKIEQLVKEYRSSGSAYVNHIYTKIRASYAHHYRKMLPRILSALEFRSNNTAWRSTLDAIEVIKASQSNRERYYAVDDVPIDGLVLNKWRDIVIEKSPDGSERINRINYEICVLHTLREKLRCKEIWVVNANRFCNPDKDLPADFEANKEDYYAALNWPTNPDEFVKQTKGKLEEALCQFNKNLPHNRKVSIKQHGKKATLSVAALTPQADPPNLEALKQALCDQWPETGLLDILKETNFRVGFTTSFSTAASREITDSDEIYRRLFLTLYGLGTNAGLKRLASGQQGVSYKELLHIRQRYISKDSLRDAIRRVVNATFEARLPTIWGEVTTSARKEKLPQINQKIRKFQFLHYTFYK